MKRPVKLRVVRDEETARVFGSNAFVARTRNPALEPPRKFEPTPKAPGDIII